MVKRKLSQNLHTIVVWNQNPKKLPLLIGLNRKPRASGWLSGEESSADVGDLGWAPGLKIPEKEPTIFTFLIYIMLLGLFSSCSKWKLLVVTRRQGSWWPVQLGPWVAGLDACSMGFRTRIEPVSSLHWQAVSLSLSHQGIPRSACWWDT